MKIHIFKKLTVCLLLMVGCGCGTAQEGKAVSDGDLEEISVKLNSQKEIAIKSKQMIKLGLSEKEDPEQVSSERNLAYTTEEFSGSFMSTIALNIRTGPSIDFQLVGNLPPYEHAVASEKAIVDENVWYKVTFGEVTGWVDASHLIPYEKGNDLVDG